VRVPPCVRQWKPKAWARRRVQHESHLARSPGVYCMNLKLETPLEHLDAEGLSNLLGRVEALKFRILQRLAPPAAPAPVPVTAEPATLVGIVEAARRIGMSRGWVYRNARKLPFTVRPNGHNLRFNTRGIEKFLRERQGAC
jgi:hypothetical protein